MRKTIASAVAGLALATVAGAGPAQAATTTTAGQAPAQHIFVTPTNCHVSIGTFLYCAFVDAVDTLSGE